ncbi:hypothetical protein Bca52824_010180 [Brassica carinata]|uniref:Uncharacterized protein n=1 Tax=Brassica carinata TaxID=52824 RepID=A0A8X7WDP9_BRACI|nr:hypothetical protein Bca52824_010180 [Brassica carinata]
MTPVYLAHRRRTHRPCADATHPPNLIDQVPPIFRYGWRAAPQLAWEKTNPHRYSPLWRAHAIPTGPKLTPKPRKVIVLDTTNLSLAQDAPPDFECRGT